MQMFLNLVLEEKNTVHFSSLGLKAKCTEHCGKKQHIQVKHSDHEDLSASFILIVHNPE